MKMGNNRLKTEKKRISTVIINYKTYRKISTQQYTDVSFKTVCNTVVRNESLSKK